jgi:hypothetical protein
MYHLATFDAVSLEPVNSSKSQQIELRIMNVSSRNSIITVTTNRQEPGGTVLVFTVFAIICSSRRQW